jgi:hypothetical protein
VTGLPLEWIVPLLSAAGITIAAMTLQHRITRSRADRAFTEGQRVEQISELKRTQEQRDLWQIGHEREDSQTHALVATHSKDIEQLRELASLNREDHKAMFGKLDELGRGMAKLLNGGPR